MSLVDLKATMSLEKGNFTASIKSAQKELQSVGEVTNQTMKGISESHMKAQSVAGKAYNKMVSDGERYKNQQSSLTATVVKTAAAFVGIRSAADLFNSAIARVDKIQSAEKAIEALTGSNEDAKTVMEGLQRVVDGTPLSLDSFTASAKGMVAAGMEADKVEPIMKAVGDAAYGVGNGAESIDIMAAAFKSLQASGTASLGDLNRLMDQNIPVYKILGNQLEMSTEDMKKYISDGLLPAGEAMDLLAKGIEEGTDGINGSTASMAGQMETAGTTIAGAAGNIKTAFVKSLAVPITESYDKIVNGMIAVKDKIKEMQPQMEAVFSGIAEIIEGVVLGIVDSFGIMKSSFEAIKPVLTGVIDVFKAFLPEGTSLTDVARKLTPIILGLYSAFKGYQVIAKTAHTLDTIQKAATGSQLAMEGLSGASRLLATGMKGLGLSFASLTNPIFLVVAAVGAAVAAVVYFWKTNEDFRNAVKDIWDKVVQVFNDCGKAIKKFIDDTVKFFQEMWQAINNVWDKVLSYITEVSAKIWTNIKEVWDKITTYISEVVEKIKQVIQVGFMLVAEIVKGIMLIIKTAIEFVWNAIVAYYTYIFETIKAIFTFTFEILERIVTTASTAIKEFITDIWNSIVEFFTPTFEAIAEIFTTAWEAIKEIVMSFITPLVAGIKREWEHVKEFTEIIWTAITETLKVIWEGIVEIATTVWTAITETISAAWNKIKEVTIAIWTAVKDWLTSVWNKIKEVATVIWTAISEFFVQVWNRIKAVAISVWTAISDFLTASWNAVKSAAINIWTAIKEFLTSVWNSIKEIATTVWTAIKDFMQSVWDSMLSLIKTVANSIKDFVTNVWNGIKDTTETVWNNIKDAMVKPVERAKEIISDIIDAIKGFFDGISLRLPSIEMPPLPHFSLSGSFSLNPPSVPSLGVDWYATGGIATAPSIVGIGEAGDEAIVPLSNKGRMKPFAQAVSAMIDRDSSGGSGKYRDHIVNLNVDTAVVREEADIKRISQELHRMAKRERV